VGKSLHDVLTPAAVIDRAKAKHIYKLTLMQVGEECKYVRLIVSTIIEAEHLVLLRLDYKDKRAAVNVLYGMPLGPSQVDRLAKIRGQLGEGSITALIDHPTQLSEAVVQIPDRLPISIFIKTNCGSHRAGIIPSTLAMVELVKAVNAREVSLMGFYSHAGYSYNGNTPAEAMEMLKHEISTSQSAIQHINREFRTGKRLLTICRRYTNYSICTELKINRSHTLSAESLRDLISQLSHSPSTTKPSSIQQTLQLYPLLDMQQLATTVPLCLCPTARNFAST